MNRKMQKHDDELDPLFMAAMSVVALIVGVLIGTLIRVIT